MIVDSHQHVCWHGRDAAGLVADMDAHDIAVAWLLAWEVPPAEDAPSYHRHFNPVHLRGDGTHPGLPLSDVLRACERYPGRFVPGYCPPPALGDAPGALESACLMHGVRVCGEWKCRCLLDDPRCIELFRKAGELHMPVVLHIDVPYLAHAETAACVYQREWYGGTIDNLARAAAACPETVFIGHGPGFWREISGDADAAPDVYPRGPIAPGGRLVQLLDTNANVWADLSAHSALTALRRDPAHAGRLLRRFADRLLFARDYYGGELTELLDTLDLPADVREKIHSANAISLLR